MGMDEARRAVEIVAAGPDAARLAELLPWVSRVRTEDQEECALQIYSAAQASLDPNRTGRLTRVLERWHVH